jgi:hypothetical protein
MARPETCSFSVQFDDDLWLPMIDTLVYVGHERAPRSDGCGSSNTRTHLLIPKRRKHRHHRCSSGSPTRQLRELVDFSGLVRRLQAIAADHFLKKSDV